MYPAAPKIDERWHAFVSELVSQCGILDEKVERATIDAFAATPRADFVTSSKNPSWEDDFRDEPVAIGFNEFLSKPSILIRMVSLLAPVKGARILEVGCGSGYASAVMSRFGAKVFGVENTSSLAQQARKRLDSLGFQNVIVHRADGMEGWAEHAPFDGIMLSVPVVSVPQALVDQLAIGGRLIAPLETMEGVSLFFYERSSSGFKSYMLEQIDFA